MTSTTSSSPDQIDLAKLELERSKFRADVAKWVVIALGAVVSFVVIDVGRLRVERFRTESETHRQLLNAYLEATESPQPDVWKRKLHILENFATDDRIREWAATERAYVELFSAQDALYRETLRVASQLIEPGLLTDAERQKARVRFNQLYWADLPYARESDMVISAMVAFREQLQMSEGRPGDKEAWEQLNVRLINLSKALRDSAQRPPAQTPGS